MDGDVVNIEETGGGDTAEMQIASVSGGETESILAVLTSIFLIVATIIVALKLYLSYGFLKDPVILKDEESKIEKRIKG